MARPLGNEILPWSLTVARVALPRWRSRRKVPESSAVTSSSTDRRRRRRWSVTRAAGPVKATQLIEKLAGERRADALGRNWVARGLAASRLCHASRGLSANGPILLKNSACGRPKLLIQYSLYPVFKPCFHPFRRYGQHPLVQIKLRPTGLTGLRRTGSCQNRKSQGTR